MPLTKLDLYSLRHLVAHLVAAGKHREALAITSSLPVLMDQVLRIGADAPVADHALLLDRSRGEIGPELRAEVENRLTALRQAGHILHDAPAELPSQLSARLRRGEVGEPLDRQMHRFRARPWLEPVERGWQAVPRALIRSVPAAGRFIDAITISADARHALSGDRDGAVALWDLEAGAALDRVLVGESVTAIASIAESCIVVTDRGTMVVLETRGRFRETGRYLLEGTDYVTAAYVREEGVLTGHFDGTVRAFGGIPPRERWSCRAHEAACEGLVVLPAGLVASVSKDGGTALIDSDTGAIRRRLAPSKGELRAVAASPDGRLVLTGVKSGLIYVHELGSVGPPALLKGHSNAICAMVVSPDARRAVSASFDGQLLLWDLHAREAAQIGRHGDWALCVDVAWTLDTAASGSADGTIRTWRLSDASDPPATPARRVRALKASGAGAYALAAGPGRLARTISFETGREVARHNLAGGEVVAVDATPDGRYAVLTSYSGRVWRLDLREMATVRIAGHDRGADAVAVTPDGMHAVTAGRDSTVRVWEIATGRETRVIRCDEPLRAVAVSPDGRLIAVSDWSHRVTLYTRSRGKLVRRFIGHEKVVEALAFAGPARVVSGSWDGAVKLWHRSTPDPRWEYRRDAWVTALAVLDSGRYAICGYADGWIELLDLGRRRPVRAFAGHGGWVNTLEVDKRGELLVSAAGDHTVRVWDIGSGRCLCSFTDEVGIECAAVAPNALSIVTGNYKGELHTFRLHRPATRRAHR